LVKIRYILFTIIALCFARGIYAQGKYPVTNLYPLYSQYLLDGLVINPAYAGTRDALTFSLSTRKMMLGFEGESTMGSLSLHTPLKNDRIALGLSVNHVSFGISKQTSVFGYYAFHINTDKGKWSLGIKGGIDMLTNDYSDVTTNDPGDPAFENVGEESFSLFNLGVGAYYVSPKFFAGVSVPALFTYKSDTLSADYKFGIDPRYYDILFSAGMLLSYSEALKFKPSVMVRYNLTNTLRLDLNGNFILYDFVWVGASWRIGEEALVGLLELQLSQQLRLGYSYDYYMGAINSFVGGTHEIALRFEFGKKVSAENPRYF
jgi:type IX secretion system PorP/SprF family membrane protein